MIIALCGLKGSGKTTLAKLLSNEERSSLRRPFYYNRLSFAKPLYLMLETLLAYQGATEEEVIYILGKGKEEKTHYLDGQTPRHALQTLGTEWGRVLISSDIWTNSLCKAATLFPNIVIDDLRFLNEAGAIRNLKGKLIRIERPGIEPDLGHISELEQFRIDVDWVIANDGEPDDMLRELDQLMGGKLWKTP